MTAPPPRHEFPLQQHGFAKESVSSLVDERSLLTSRQESDREAGTTAKSTQRAILIRTHEMPLDYNPSSALTHCGVLAY